MDGCTSSTLHAALNCDVSNYKYTSEFLLEVENHLSTCKSSLHIRHICVVECLTEKFLGFTIIYRYILEKCMVIFQYFNFNQNA
jgi:hypothetical protein